MQIAKTVWGPRKMSVEEYARQQDELARTTRDGTVYGSRKGGGKSVKAAAPAPAPEPEKPKRTRRAAPKKRAAPAAEANQGATAEAATPPEKGEGGEQGDQVPAANPYVTDDADGRLNLDELEARLGKHPEELDLAIQAEFRGGKRARKGAVALFVDLEHAREGGARDGVLKLLGSQA